MEDLSLYTEEEIYEMLEEGTITIDDLDYYIKNGTIDARALETYLKGGLIDIKDLDVYIKTGYVNTKDIASYINTGTITVEEVAAYIQSGVIDATTLSNEVVGVAETQQIEAIHGDSEVTSMEEPNIETVEETTTPTTIIEPPEQNEEPVIEDPEIQPVEEIPESPVIEEAEQIVKDDEYIYIDSDGNSYEEAKYSMEETYRYCILAGMNIKDISLDGKGGRGPFISFEINNGSKQMLDHLMSELYANNDGIALEFMRNMSTRDELFTIEIDPSNISREEFYAHVRDTFQKIHETVQTTRKDLDYASTMPDGLRIIKERFRNDDPDIGQDFTIGYVRNDGKDSYYIVADNTAKAQEYARSIGYDIKNRQGANVFEVETNGSVTNTKLEDASVDLSGDKKVMDVESYGISNLDIYGNIQQDPKEEVITHFIETSNDPHLMCVLAIEVPENNPGQRVVTMKSEMGGSETVVFQDGEVFDQKVMPKIIDTYVQNNPVYAENISKTEPGVLDRASCLTESENNTILMINGYSDAKTNRIVEHIQSKEKTNSDSKENTNSRQKTIGTYPTTNNSVDHGAAFVSMPVLFVICTLFVVMLSLIIFTG